MCSEYFAAGDRCGLDCASPHGRRDGERVIYIIGLLVYGDTTADIRRVLGYRRMAPPFPLTEGWLTRGDVTGGQNSRNDLTHFVLLRLRRYVGKTRSLASGWDRLGVR